MISVLGALAIGVPIGLLAGLGGRFLDAVISRVAKGRFDLVVMGSRGHGSFVNLVMGSVATKVLASCGTPVLLVR